MIAAFFATLFAGIKTTISLGLIGAAAGVAAQLVGRLVSGLTGYIAAAAIGAIVLVGAYGSASFDSYRTKLKDQEIAQLKYDKARAQRDLEAATAANEQHERLARAAAEQAEADKAQLERLAELSRQHEADLALRPVAPSQGPGTPPRFAPAPARPCIYDDELREIFRR